MKHSFLKSLALAAVAGLLAVAPNAQAVILITDVGINVTNKNGVLVPDVPQGDLDSQSPEDQFAWLDSLVAEPYNTIASASLPEPAGLPGSLFIQDDDASENGDYSLVAGMSYYIVAHYGRSNTAWYIASASGSDTYAMPSQASDFGGEGRGLSNVRIWQAESDDTPSVPEGGTSVALLGLTLAGLGAARRFTKKA